nr:PepSY domain-containing protein [uncultured Methylophaga sp.]
MKFLVLFILSSFSGTLLAEDSTQFFERCLSVVTDLKPGHVIKVERKVENERDVYEFDIRGIDGADWDVECSVRTGKVLEVEQEVDHPNHPKFKAHAKMSEAEARDIALEMYPGEIVEVEYEIEEDGKATYEFDIATRDGKEMKIEIDAASGKVIEQNLELWQVGLE